MLVSTARDEVRPRGFSLAAALMAAALITLAAARPAAAGDRWRGKVLEVLDGPRLVVIGQGKKVKVALHGVQSFEAGQKPADPRPRQHLSALVQGKHVHVRPVRTERRGGVVAVVCLYPLAVKSNRCLAEELVRAGLARWDRAAAPKMTLLGELEAEARRERRGLWAESSPALRKLPPPPSERPARSGRDPKAPNTPLSDESRACTRDTDCVFLPTVCPQCPPCTPTPRKVGNRKSFDRIHALQTVASCVWRTKCPPCASDKNWRGGKPACVAGRCELSAPEGEKHRACKTSRDCTLAPHGGCGCGPCGETWNRPVNRAYARWLQKERARKSCPPVACAPCKEPVVWRGERAGCLMGQCEMW